MADSKYSMSEATLDSFGFSTFSVAAAPYGLSGFSGAMAQLGAALNEVSLDIRLLTVEQGKLGEVISSLTAALFAPRSQLSAFSRAPGARDESPFRLDVEVQPRPSLESPRLMAHQADNHTCTCELKSPIQVTVETKVEQPDATPPPSPIAALEAKLDQLRSIVPAEYSGPIDRVSAYAKEHPQLAGQVYDAGAKAVEVVVDEAMANLAQKFLKRLPGGLGTLLGEDDDSVDDDSVDDAGAGGQGPRPSQKKARPPKGSPRRQRYKARKKNSKASDDIKVEVRRRNPPAAMASMQPLASLYGPPMTQGFSSHSNLAPSLSLSGRAPNAASLASRTAAPTRVAEAARSLMSLYGPPMTQNFSSHANLAPSFSLSGRAPIVTSLAGKVAAPIRMAEAAIALTQGIASGDTKAVVASAGNLTGSSAGAAAGAAIGTMIFPGVGTAIGGLVGGLAGSEVGAMLGEKLVGLVDRLRTPDQVSKDLTTAAAPPSAPINFAPSIQVTCPNADNAEQIRSVVAQQLQAQFHGEFVPLMNHNALATRRDAALTDGGV